MVVFSRDVLDTLLVPGISERWAAVQEQLQPILAEVVEGLDEAGRSAQPRIWPMYESSWKTARSFNRGRGGREPINEYHFAVDRPPRGAGVYVGASGDERAVLVGLTVSGKRKAELQRVWEAGRAVWQPLIEGLTEVRFAGVERDGQTDGQLWIERYVASKSAQYLWAGYRYSWDDPQVYALAFRDTLIADVLRLLPLVEAVMEEAEARAWTRELREQPGGYNIPAALPAAEEVVRRIAASGFAYPEAVVRSYHVALQTKPLVILPGISGTGKTRLTRLYADAVHNVASNGDNPYYLLVAVQPDWHNAKDLLGYYNALTGTFHPTAFLRFLHRAAGDPEQQYYVGLDEMNLARPEYYLAPLLSALETTEHLIDLNTPGPSVQTVDGETLTNPFRLPLNVAITGTVNVDESTFGLSDKLLDRANVIELTEVDLDAFRRTYQGPVDPLAWAMIAEIHALLTGVSQPFGYRTITEMLRYVANARTILRPEQALDLQIKQKILPKVRGEDSPRLRQALTALRQLLVGSGGDQPRFPEATAKVTRMLERLQSEGFTDFYGS